MNLEQPYTIASIVDEARDILHGYVRMQDQSTSLLASMTDSDLSFTTNGHVSLSRGIVEIEDELVYVGQVADGSAATVEPWGRGQSGTTAVSHAAGARVTMSPLYPRHRIATTVVGVLREIFPDVFAVAQTELDINPARTNYTLPTDAYHVLSVEWNWPGPSQMWAPVARWRQNKPTTGLEVEVISGTWPGQDRVRVKYAMKPPTNWEMTGDLNTDYGYDHEIRDVIVLGTVARLLAYTEPSRLQVKAPEVADRAESVPAGALHEASRYFFGLFRSRLDEERRQILLRHPIQPHRSR